MLEYYNFLIGLLFCLAGTHVTLNAIRILLIYYGHTLHSIIRFRTSNYYNVCGIIAGAKWSRTTNLCIRTCFEDLSMYCGIVK